MAKLSKLGCENVKMGPTIVSRNDTYHVNEMKAAHESHGCSLVKWSEV